MHPRNRLVIGISGASCARLAILLLEEMQRLDEWESHVVISSGGQRTLEFETGLTTDDLRPLASQIHPLDDIGASIASGTFKTAGMVIVPCSMKTLAGIASGYSANLLLRAADVTLKERRKLVLVARETPLHLIHLRNMVTASEVGAVILPPMLTEYCKPESLHDAEMHIVGKILGEFGIELRNFKRWGGMPSHRDAS